MIDLISVGTELMNLLDGRRWFICFGTLLQHIRGKLFQGDSDIDIGIIGPIDDLEARIENPIRNDQTGELLHCWLRLKSTKAVVDVFRWIPSGNYYWHTYDTLHESPSSGIPSTYEFKGSPKRCFDPPGQVIDRIKNSTNPYRVRATGEWVHPVKLQASGGVYVQAPHYYGELLDLWYPDWHIPDAQFGVSMASKTIVCKSCKELGCG